MLLYIAGFDVNAQFKSNFEQKVGAVLKMGGGVSNGLHFKEKTC